MAMFTPVGHARELAAATCGSSPRPSPTATPRSPPAILDQAQPESPDDSAPTVAACTGLALGLLDQWLTGHDTATPDRPGQA